MLVLNDYQGLKKQVDWAQRITNDWYPLVYLAPMVKYAQHEEALKYLSSLQFSSLSVAANANTSLVGLVEQMTTTLKNRDIQPFEAEILYMLSESNGQTVQQELIKDYIRETYPEKLMLLPFLTHWVATREQQALVNEQ